jgi:hypothetical protein
MLAYADNRKTLVDEDGLLADMTPRPVGAAMTLFLGECDATTADRRGFVDSVDSKDTTHSARCRSCAEVIEESGQAVRVAEDNATGFCPRPKVAFSEG